MDYKDYYKVLGVGKKASQAEIKKKFRKLAIQYHPDKNPDDKVAESKFKEINEAYEVLGNEDNRKKYDEMGANWKHYDQFKNARGQAGQSYQYSGEFENFFGGGRGFSDFFNSFFGGGGGFSSNPFQSGRPHQGHSRPRATNAKGELSLSFDEAFHGVGKTIQINGEKVKLSIKPGARSGQKLKLKGKGQNGGDLLITLNVQDSTHYKLSDSTISAFVDIDYYTAVLGGKARVRTPHGEYSLNIPAGTNSGKKFRLKNKGWPTYGKVGSTGDFIAETRIKVPSSPTEKERELLKELRDLNSAKA